MRSLSRRALLALACVLASCAHDDEGARATQRSTSAGRPMRATLPDGTMFELPAAPRRVVPANTAAAEFVAQLLGPERLAGLPEQVDEYSSFDFKSRGFERVPRFSRYAAEALIVLRPDLVVTHSWQAAETTAVLRNEGTPVLVLQSATSYADIRATLLACAELFGLAEAGEKLASDLDQRVARLRERAARSSKLRALVYSNDGTGGWAAGSGTTADTLLALVGLVNAAAEAGVKGHAGLDFEKLIAISPDVFVVAAPVRGEGGSATKAVLESTPALASLRALKNGSIAVLPAALLASDSPCLVDGAEALAREIDRMAARPGAGARKP